MFKIFFLFPENPSVLAEPMVCESCAKEEGHNSMVQCCDGHVVCTKCVEASAKKVLVGERKGSIGCPQLECNSSVPMSKFYVCCNFSPFIC